jgi:hypothetical protein
LRVRHRFQGLSSAGVTTAPRGESRGLAVPYHPGTDVQRLQRPLGDEPVTKAVCAQHAEPRG